MLMVLLKARYQQILCRNLCYAISDSNVVFASPSGCLLELFSDDFAEELLEGCILMLGVCPEGIIEHRLVVPTTLGFCLGLEPLDKITI